MKSRISSKTRLRTGLKLRLRYKVIIGIGLLLILSGIAVIIILNTGRSTEVKADTKDIKAPLNNNAYFTAAPDSYIEFGCGRDLSCISNIPNNRELTVSMWVQWGDFNTQGVGPYAELFSLCDSAGSGLNGTFWMEHNYSNSSFRFSVKTANNGRVSVTSTTHPVAGQWYHLTGVYKGNGGISRLYIYVNGILEATTNNVSGNLAPISATSRLNMGRWCNPQDNYRHFNGYLDDVSIWTIALTASQVMNLTTNPTSVTGNSYNASGLIGFWNFDDYTATSQGSCTNTGIIGPGATLPVELISFTAEKKGNEVDLEWITASEHNNDYFLVERSLDLEHFETVDKLSGAGESNNPIRYRSTDREPGDALNYYRLRQVDFDGSTTLSKVIVVSMNAAKSDAGELKASPNPFSDQLILSYKALVPGPIDILLYDLNGKVVTQKEDEVLVGDNTLQFAVNSDIRNGYYLLCVRQNNANTHMVKLLKSL
jgi:hypothetical protein